MPSELMEHLLQVKMLSVFFRTRAGLARAVDGVDLHMSRGECVALVGESGCGKTVGSLAIMRLLPENDSVSVKGEAIFKGRDLLALPEREMRRVRGAEISMIFQEPQSALNPVFTIGEQVAEALLIRGGTSRREAFERAEEALRAVKLPDPRRMMGLYPHELSGGMKQRVMIAMALVASPSVLIADEPTTALDVTVQAQILDLLDEIRKARGLGLLLITHDLGVVSGMAERMYVMYAGKVVESGATADVLDDPMHPYTQGLLRARPAPGRKDRLAAIPGSVPPATAMPPGCRFAPRCPWADEGCSSEEPALRELSPGHSVACPRAGRGRGCAWSPTPRETA